MSRKEAESISGLDSRENMAAHYEYLRCLLGLYETVMVQTSAFRTVPQRVFKLISFGSSWENAIEMLEKKQKAKQAQ